ncbi:MAG: 1,4-alpha-glucan branching protein GlgB [Pseudohongiellaceae bacterium]|nr:1,4-alpha-glucan branching protein GlgB [Pseudohongiellaceae bacterium]
MTQEKKRSSKTPRSSESKGAATAAKASVTTRPTRAKKAQKTKSHSEQLDARQLHISNEDLYLFSRGEQESAWRFLGANHYSVDGVEGVLFGVWAPTATMVSVIGDFNDWNPDSHRMNRHPGFGVWELFVPKIKQGVYYKYQIISESGDIGPWKADPYARQMQLRPDNASVVPSKAQYAWADEGWMSSRADRALYASALNIYEVHLGSWRRHWHDNAYLSYRELADQLISYVKEMRFNTLQLMPITEYPFDGSWGYQPIGMFAPTSRYGSPDDLRYLIDCAHQNGIAVLLDWVPAHFPNDEHGLSQFDGSFLYEHEDPRQGFHPDWNTLIYNYGRAEVISYLLSNAMYWLQEFHVDGLRFDAVASMLYRNYSREEGEWVPNHHGGVENLEAIHLLKTINERAYSKFPGIAMVAEESTAWLGVTGMTSDGGLGFGFKWNLGWMNDTLRYMSHDPIHRKYHANDIGFGLLYAFSENFILALSHDEVVHGKKSLVEKMPGDEWQKFANLRAYYGLMWAHPGKKLLFMGGEFAQRSEWNHDTALDWTLLDWEHHRGVQSLVRDLNTLVENEVALHELDYDGAGFEWVEEDNFGHCVFAFLRFSLGRQSTVLAVSNMTPTPHESYRIGVNAPGFYRELLNTDSKVYAGTDMGNYGGCWAQEIPSHGRDWSVEIQLPPLATVIFRLETQ